jgi:hypothetical protein
MQTTTIKTDIDFERDGKQVSVLRLPDSTNSSAMRTIPIPIAMLKHGKGPTVLLMAGNHGDEFEGQVTLAKLMRSLEPVDIEGRIIFLPAANLPAVLTGTRNSPLDGQNLNRVFPGTSDGPLTAQIAHYITSVLLPMCDAWLDLHSGGASLDFMPCVNVLLAEDKALARRTMDMARAFDAPLVVVYDDLGGGRSSLSAALRQGILCLNTEMGGAAELSKQGLRICERGVRNVLAWLRVLRANAAVEPVPRSMRVVQHRAASYVYAPEAGLFEAFGDLGDMVEEGHVAGRLHFINAPMREPLMVNYRQSGLLYTKRPLARVEAGDCVALVVADAELP